ncbi:MAG: hypothetical protein Q4G69_06075 [Planctomycetia bacterium]|nr:hypothetical protein [Planctomycetia bacterium]
MTRLLAVDWDQEEVRFLLGDLSRETLSVLKWGSLPIPKELSEKDSENPEDHDDPEGSIDSEVSIDSKKSESEAVVSAPAQNDPAPILKTLLRQNQMGSFPLLLALQRSDTEIQFLNLPNMSESELPDLVKNQVLRDSATYIEGQPLDFLVLQPKNPDEGLPIMSVSITRIRLKELRSILSAAGRRAKKMELRATAIAEFARSNKILPLPDEDSGQEKPFLIVQEGPDEVNLLLWDQGKAAALRSFKTTLPESESGTDDSRLNRLYAELIRTITIYSVDRPTPIDRVVLFGENRPSRLPENKAEEEEAGAEKSEENQEGSAPQNPSEKFYHLLEKKLRDQEITLEVVHPFLLEGITARTDLPDRPERFAPLIGMILAERAKERPLIDLLHPHEKPKPPNYFLCFFALFFFLGCFLIYSWSANKKILENQRTEISQLEKQRNSLALQIQSIRPLHQILMGGWNWENRSGIIILDELRDITLRIPNAPDLIITRLAYNGDLKGKPVFIISGKIRSLEVYQQFYQGLTFDRSHSIVSPGPQPLKEGGFSHEFSAQIFCIRRPYSAYYMKLPPEIQKISNQSPQKK